MRTSTILDRLRARRRLIAAFSLIEIMIGLSLVVLIGVYLADSFIFASRAERAVSKKMIAARALQYIQFRLRRDAKWARAVQGITPISGSQGSFHGVEFRDLANNKRTYKWSPTSMELTLPRIGTPNNTEEKYDQCKFRWVDFNFQEAGNEGVRVLLSPLPNDERLDLSSEKEAVWGVAMVGRTELDALSVQHRYHFFNEPAFPRPPTP